MSDDVIIISPEIYPGAGGLADYSLRVVEQWHGRVPVRFIIPAREDQFSDGPARSVEVVARSTEAMLAKLPASGGAVLLQYSAYGFDQYGYPRWLLRAVADWKRHSGGTLVVMLHEIWGFWPVLNKNYLVQQLHRRDLRTLLACADSIFTSTASQADHLRALCPERAVEVLPVGTNIVPSFSAEKPRDAATAVIFGLQGSRLHVLEKLRDGLRSAAVTNHIEKLITVGGGMDPKEAKREQDLLAGLGLRNGFEQRGPLPETEVSELLSQAGFGISAQDELSVTKSGTFMAYAAHGMNILSPFANAAAAEPLCWTIDPAELTAGIPDEQLRTRAESLRNWQERTCSWPKIAEQFARALRLGSYPTEIAPSS